MIPANFAAYRTLWRDYNVTSVSIRQETNILEVIKKAKGNNLEEKIKEVIHEEFNFKRENAGENFRKKLFSYLQERVGEVRYQHLSLEDKIMYAQMFSSSLEYNYKANWMEHVGSDGFAKKAFESTVEFYKINHMSLDEIADYKTVVCGQFARVFAAALHTINDNSTNREDIHVATLGYVLNYDYKHKNVPRVVISALNAFAFGEYRDSIAHMINIVATDKKFYIIEPQDEPSQPISFSNDLFDIDVDYAGKIK